MSQVSHDYLSIACYHKMHDDCLDLGINTCKFCNAPCNCYCHKIEREKEDQETAKQDWQTRANEITSKDL